MPTGTALSDYQLDEACLMAGRRIEKQLAEGEEPFAEHSNALAKAAPLRGRARKVKIKENGTW